jgi:hypothetical protein
MTGQWRFMHQHESIVSAQESADGSFIVQRNSSANDWDSASGQVYDNCTVSIEFSPGLYPKLSGKIGGDGCRVLTWSNKFEDSYWVRHVETTLSSSLALARQDVLLHVAKVEAAIQANSPPAGSIGEYLIKNGVYRKAAMFGIFNTTFLNEDADGATDQETELVFQCTGLPDKKDVGAVTNQAMWLRDSGAQMHFYVASGLAAKSPPLTRVLQALLRQHMRLVLLDSWANSFTQKPFEETQRAMRRGGFVNTGYAHAMQVSRTSLLTYTRNISLHYAFAPVAPCTSTTPTTPHFHSSLTVYLHSNY